MIIPRIIPVLLLSEGGLYKTKAFKKPVYVGDPINCIRIFNEKEVDELILLDIAVSRKKIKPNINYLREISEECFMPLTYGGGINSINDAEEIFKIGIEKIVLGTSAHQNPGLIREITSQFGCQSVIVSVDVKRDWRGRYKVYYSNGTNLSSYSLESFIRTIVDMGVGEILVNNIQLDGSLLGYDLELIQLASALTNVPVIACGGGNSLQNFCEAFQAGASAVAAGSFFIFHGKFKAVLMTYPTQNELVEVLKR